MKKYLTFLSFYIEQNFDHERIFDFSLCLNRKKIDHERIFYFSFFLHRKKIWSSKNIWLFSHSRLQRNLIMKKFDQERIFYLSVFLHRKEILTYKNIGLFSFLHRKGIRSENNIWHLFFSTSKGNSTMKEYLTFFSFSTSKKIDWERIFGFSFFLHRK